MTSHTRITGLRQRMTSGQASPRPPWATQASILENCTSCGHCISACPEGILIEGPAKTPTVSFKSGECTFCQKCAQVCPEDVFVDVDQRPWTVVAHIDQSCMLNAGIGCQLCTDACSDTALKIDLSHRPMGRIVVSDSACTGCGACVSFCPEDAIKIREPAQEMVGG